jgi:Leucine-rich repeat (LRR) protein
LPATVGALDFSGNNLTALSDKQFFANVTQLQRLELKHNNIVKVLEGVFDLMPGLAELDLSHNPFASHPDFALSVHNVLNTPTLAYVSFQSTHMSLPQLQAAFRDVRNGHIQALNFNSNHLPGHVDLSLFRGFPQLVSLSLSASKVQSVSAEPVLTLRQLDVSHNALVDFPPSCGANETSMFPALEFLDLSHNRFSALVLHRHLPLCFPNLNILDLSGYVFGSVLKHHAVVFPSLTSLYALEPSSETPLTRPSH